MTSNSDLWTSGPLTSPLPQAAGRAWAGAGAAPAPAPAGVGVPQSAAAAADPNQCRALPARQFEEGAVPRRGVAGTSRTVSVIAAVAAVAAVAALEDGRHQLHQGVIRRIQLLPLSPPKSQDRGNPYSRR